MSRNSGGWSGFAKTILIPLLIALVLYISIFHAVLPVYRRYQTHITRYAAYTPLASGLTAQTTTFFNPILEPSRSLWERTKRGVRMTLWRLAVPGVQHVDLEHRFVDSQDDEDGEEMRNERHLIDEDDDDDDGIENSLVFSGDAETNINNRHRLTTRVRDEVEEDDRVFFDDHTAGNLIGFDLRSSSGDGRQFGLGRRRAQSQTQSQLQTGSRTRSSQHSQRRGMERRMIGGAPNPVGGRHAATFSDQVSVMLDVDDSNRRLSRELEEGFRDDSSHSEDELEQGVTVGRKSLSQR